MEDPVVADALLDSFVPLYDERAARHPSLLVPEYWALGFDKTRAAEFPPYAPPFYRESRALLSDAEWAILAALDFDSGFRASFLHKCLPCCFKGRFAHLNLCRFRF